ncbi:MAG: hypothetical protein MUE64_00015 [Ignavibacteriaceae bacterium]|jgi:hypothetical protein|nr:hypothetical protein [Ignavibacteriaceae bacterium]
MKKTFNLFIFIILPFAGNSQTYVSDSVTYRYVGSMSEENGELLLRQFHLNNYITKLPLVYETEIIRDGDFITLRTPLGPVLEDSIPKDFTPWRIKIIGITIQNRTDPKKISLKNGINITEQTFFRESDMGVYHTDNEAYIPINTMDSPYVTVIWQLIDFNRDGKQDQLRFCLINSRDICEIFYCHPK